MWLRILVSDEVDPANVRFSRLARVYRSYIHSEHNEEGKGGSGRRTSSLELLINPVRRSNAKSLTLGIFSSQGVKL